MDMFAWSTYDVPEIDPEFICHQLNMNPEVTPQRHSSKEHAEAVRAEVNKLKQVGAIKEVFYPEWLANTVTPQTRYPDL